LTAPSHHAEPSHGPPDKRNPPGGGSGGLEKTSLLGSFDYHHLAPKPPAKQAQIISLRERRRIPAPRRHLAVQITAFDGHSPIGRTRPFRLSDRDFERLIDHALQLEARA
jgi:hypothetical protein